MVEKGMFMRAAFFSFLALPAVAGAEPALVGDFEQCIEFQVTNNRPVAACVAEAHAKCDDFSPVDEPAAALLCYRTAKEEWGVKVAAFLDDLPADPKDINAAARVEAKFALLRNALTCDYQQELLLTQRDPVPEDQISHARCQAMASAVSLVEVMGRVGRLKPPQ